MMGDTQGTLEERLREWCRDWDGSEMADGAETRTTVDCRTMREAADEIASLRARVAVLVGALTGIIDRSNNDPIGTSKVIDMRNIARAALASITGEEG